MGRRPRIHIPGAIYHVILRGNARQNIFFGGQDCVRLCELIAEGVSRFGHRVHAFCLMPNHLHLVIQVADVSLSRILQNVLFRYARWVNRRLDRTGHLFQGRFRAILVDSESYLLELVRYIHLNPVRAGLVADPVEYAWSGHSAYLGLEEIPWLTTAWVLSQFSDRIPEARVRYQWFVGEGIGEGARLEFRQGSKDPRLLGADRFIEETLAKIEKRPTPRIRLDVIVRRVCLDYGITEPQLRAPGRHRTSSEARAVIAWLAIRLSKSTLTEVARRFDRDVSTMSLALRRVTSRSDRSEELRQRLDSLVRSTSPRESNSPSLTPD